MRGRWAMVRAWVVTGAMCLGCTARAGGIGSVLIGDDAGATDEGNGTDDLGNPATCAPPRAVCHGACVNTLTSTANCGGCDNPCSAGQSCVAGACTQSAGCATPQMLCNGTCTDVQSDSANCGSCGVACSASQHCANSACVGGTVTCTSPRTLCGATCTNILTDPANCGVCGLPCSAGQVCVGGNCMGGGTGCGTGQVSCGGMCTVLSSDPRNCGGCGHACLSGQTCLGGACRTGSTGTTYAGNACTVSAVCGSLMCDTSVGGGWCTNNCTETGTSSEASACGGGSATCVTIGDTMPQSVCARACTPGAGACRSGFVCTGWWYTHAMGTPDSPGCFPFCRSNADCGAGYPVCNTRTGSCGMTAADFTRLPDGSPCDPTMTTPDAMGNPVNTQCRGVCLQVGMGATEGMCGSFINLAVSPTCPDSPATIQPRGLRGMDDLGICIFPTCASSASCGAGLTCLTPPGGTTQVCTYAS